MKKQYFIFSVMACMVIFNVKAQNTPIDAFLKELGSHEGVTSVSMSQQMLRDIFTAPRNASVTYSSSSTQNHAINMNHAVKVPEAYISISISKDDLEQMMNVLKMKLLDAKYEPYMEVNRENSNILGYYLKKVNDKSNEIVVLRQQNNQFSAIYIKGDIDFKTLDSFLRRIKSALNQMETSDTGTFQSDQQFVRLMPFKFPEIQELNLKFDSVAR